MAYNENNAQAYQERYIYEGNYYHGLCTTTETGKRYADLLSRYKHSLNAEIKTLDRAVDAHFKAGSNKKNLIVLGVLVVVWLLFDHILSVELSTQMGIVLASDIAIAVLFHEAAWAIAPFVIYFALSFFGYGEIAYVGTLVAFAFRVIQLLVSSSTKTASYDNTVNQSAELRRQLSQLKPQMAADLDAWQQEWYQRNRSVLAPDDLLNYRGDHFPPAFWWEMDYDEVCKMDDLFTCKKYGSWEDRLVPREPGTEFDAEGEFTPFCQMDKPHKEVVAFFRENYGGVVFDVISRLNEIVGTHENVIQYQVPAHSSLETFSARMGVYSLAKDIDSAYNSGSISGADHIELASDVSSLAFLTEEWANQTKTQTYTEHIPIRAHSNLWTGQFILIPNGNKHYRMQQYYCQLPHMVENLKCLKAQGVIIDYIEIDWFNNIPYFLNQFFSYYPDAV